jgi:long-chain acyl-CoA synthetase
MREASWPNLAAMFYAEAAAHADRPFLWAKQDGAFRPMTWREAAARAASLARALIALGVGRGDRVALVAENRPEWLIADLAIITAGAVTVPSYTTNGVADHQYVLSHSGAKGAIVSTAALARRLAPALAEAPDARFAIAIEPTDGIDWGRIVAHRWDDAIARHAAAPEDGAQLAAALSRDDTACLIYTSGTGGRPKGVMLSHGAILANCAGAYAALSPLGLEREVFLSFLPLSHAYEHTAGQFFPISIGAEIYYTDAESLAADLLLARPTMMTAVPRLYETMHQRILRGVRRAGGTRARLFHAAVALGRKRYDDPASLGFGERLADVVLDLLVRRKVRAGFGGRLKAMVSGGAPLNVEIGLFFAALGLRILQGYGQTESAPVVSCNLPFSNRIDTVGPPLPGVEVKIAEDGEILVRGELVMQGYWRDPEATSAAIQDGWLHTGDIGTLDAAGRLRITDRKKDIIVVSGGDNVAPQKVEGILSLQPEIAQAMVYGDKRPHLVALIVPDAEFTTGWGRRNGAAGDLHAVVVDPAFRSAIGEAVERANRQLSSIERVRRFALVPEGFTIANGMLTPTLKVRRNRVVEHHAAAIDALYKG